MADKKYFAKAKKIEMVHQGMETLMHPLRETAGAEYVGIVNTA